MITQRTHAHLLHALVQDYEARFAHSRIAHARACDVLVDGVSHNARLYEPFPFRIAAAEGSHVTDVDGHRILDFWQGHYANILGHNPAIIRETLTTELMRGYGLQTGLPEERGTDLALALAKATGNERVRLTTAGTLATMYAIMLARAFTGRRLVVKVAGGWHGANPLALKGVDRSESGFDKVESAGVPISTGEEIIITPFNDPDNLRKLFRSLGDRIACFIMEPCMGGAGFIPATGEFMRTARELTTKYGALLILDEIITGFRFCAAGVQRLYNVQADITTLGKIIGGGMPLVAVAGRADVMDLSSSKAQKRVLFNGGTFSAHPLAVLAGKTMVEYLTTHENEIYPTLAQQAARLRTGVEKVFADRGILARCTGEASDALGGGSLACINFPLREDHVPSSAEEWMDPQLNDVTLRERVLKLGLLLQDVYIVHGLGALSSRHSDEDLVHLFEACDVFAKRLVAGQ
jgi:glutamate-1-semialdehyde 2,1-aminomutase